MELKRRNIFAIVFAPALALVRGWSKPRVESDPSLKPVHTLIDLESFYKSFDCRDWARAFIEHVKANPEIAIDEGTMQSWFANALMRGYDERRSKEPFEVKMANEGRKAIELLHLVHEDNLRGYMYSGPTRRKVAHFIGSPDECHRGDKMMLSYDSDKCFTTDEPVAKAISVPDDGMDWLRGKNPDKYVYEGLGMGHVPPGQNGGWPRMLKSKENS